MNKAELDDLLGRAQPHIGKNMPVKERNEVGRYMPVSYQFIRILGTVGTGEAGKMVYKMPRGELKSPKGKIAKKYLNIIVDHFEGLEL